MKACERCHRIAIGRNYDRVSIARATVGLIFVYLPILFLPFILAAAGLIYIHLRMMGAQQLKTLRDFLPTPGSHRYGFATQIRFAGAPRLAVWVRMKTFWMFNCTWYCPVSVATLEWTTYLVKTVENWWCPFYHDKKANYMVAAIDRSYWHTADNIGQLHRDDRDSPIFSDRGDPPAAETDAPDASPDREAAPGPRDRRRA